MAAPGQSISSPVSEKTQLNLLCFSNGGWCTSPEGCYNRSLNKNKLGSSKAYPQTTSEWGKRDLLNPDCAENYAFCNWSSFYLPYCDGLSRAGNAEIIFNETLLYLRGFEILRASLDQMLNPDELLAPDFPSTLRDATNILISGSSAGGLSTILHMDYMSSYIREKSFQTPVIKAVPEVGFFIDGESIWDGFHEMTAAFQRAADMGNITSGSSEQVCVGCKEALSPDEYWKCFMAEYCYPHLSTPTFLLNSQIDQWQLEHILAPDPDYTVDEVVYEPWVPCIEDPTACNSTQYDQFMGYHDQFMRALDTATAATPLAFSQNGGFITSCDSHDTASYGDSHTIFIGGVSMYDAMVQWVSLDSSGKSDTVAQWRYDDPWPSNPTCPPIPHLLQGWAGEIL
jgi:O-palmitoleoyl-L-serine hydrolase